MSWLLASFAIVALVLAAGWLAYERQRPSARMVAVIATLAAVAALGRDAFVALPDVKPITAIAFVVGYGLGPLPGFTVGSIGMLASNMMLGQGPYTPWQMAAWGLVGLTGAAFGALSGRHVSRIPLALACAASAAMAKEIMNVYEWTLGASHTPAAFLATAGTSLPYDVTDTVATFGFAFVFGPELARLLGRTRGRMNVSWEPAQSRLERPPGRMLSGTSLMLMVLLSATLFLGLAAGGYAASLSKELSYLTSSQNSDGGFGAARAEHSSELYTAWAAMALAATGHDPASVRRGGHSVLGSLVGEASTLSGLGDIERTILAVRACGASPYSFAGHNLVSGLLRARESDGSFAHLVIQSAFAIFALRSIGHSASYGPIRSAASWIEHQQNNDGGFSFAAHGSASDVDDTAAALQALADAGARDGRVLNAAVDYLLRSQNLDGGFPQRYGEASNAQSTAWAVQGLIAAARNVGSVRRKNSRSPIGYLEGLLGSEGSIRYSATSAQSPVWVTSEVMIALAGKTFPVAP